MRKQHPDENSPRENGIGEPSAAAPTDSELSTHLRTSLERLVKTLQEDGSRGILSTGLGLLDGLTNGIEKGNLYVIGAGDSLARTSFLLRVVAEVCLAQRIPTLLFSGDLSGSQVTDRLIYGRNHLPSPSNLNAPSYRKKGSLMRIQKHTQEISESGLVIHDSRDLTIEAIEARAHEESAKSGIGFIVIDHVHLIRSESTPPGTSRKREMSGVIRRIKNLARELELPILVGAHLKRQARRRVPRSGDIRESADIEYEADFIGLLHRQEQFPYVDFYDLLVAKNNSGMLGSIRLYLFRECDWFEQDPPVSDEGEDMTPDDYWGLHDTSRCSSPGRDSSLS